MFDLSDDVARLQFDRIHLWLASSYWSPGIARELVERSARGSHCLGAYDQHGVQVGYARMVTDSATFAWLADVWVDVPGRGRGLGRSMVRWFVERPPYAGLRRIMLATLDAHGVYAPLGFAPPSRPELIMERLPATAGAPIADRA